MKEHETPPSVKDLLARIAALEEKVRRLEAENRDLQDRLEEAQRKGARQAAPFRRRDAKKIADDRKKRPGRPQGHPGARRQIPEHIDEHITVPLNACPTCGGYVAEVEAIEQVIEEIPPVRPHVVHLVTYRGCCTVCGQVSSTHPLQGSTAVGAAQVPLGPNARAWALALNQQFGLTTRKTCRVLKGLVGLSLSPGGLAQAAQRAATKVLPSYDHLVQELRTAGAVFADETSWYVGRPGHWLWTFTTHDATVYHVDATRERRVVLEMLGEDFAGVLVSDCLSSYDALPYRQHKCIAHHQKAIAEARQRLDTPEKSYLDQWKLLLTMVSVLWRYRERLGEEEFLRQRACLEHWLDRLLEESRTQPGDQAIQNRIGKRRDAIVTCLYDPLAEPTNNRAERSLRDVGVIARKLSCGNKTEAGKTAWERLTSLAVTCQQLGHDFVSWLAAALPLAAQAGPIPQAVTPR